MSSSKDASLPVSLRMRVCREVKSLVIEPILNEVCSSGIPEVVSKINNNKRIARIMNYYYTKKTNGEKNYSFTLALYKHGTLIAAGTTATWPTP